MTETQQFIEDAIAGGYADHAYCNEFDMHESHSSYCHSTVLIDPLAWQAVGKTRGWTDDYEKVFPDDSGYFREKWYNRWCMFISELGDSKTIEEALLAIK